MNKKEVLTKITILIAVGVLLGFTPVVQAQPPPFIQELDINDNFVLPWVFIEWIEDPPSYSIPVFDFDSSRNLHFRLGAARNVTEKTNDWWPNPPWEYRFYLDGVEYELNRFAIKPDDDTHDPPIMFFWYYIFGPDYFAPGKYHTVKFEFWVKQSYQGDDLNEWRIFVDYDGIYFPEGTEYSFQYDIYIS